MQSRRIGAGFVLVMLVATAALAQKVTTDHQANVDFSRYKTFMWIKEPNTTNGLVRQRILDEVNAALSQKGLTRVDSDADLCVAAHAATQKERTLNTFYDGFGGGWRWRGGFGSAMTTESVYEVGTLVIDLFDATTKEAIWRGASTKTLSDNPQKNAASLKKAIMKMFEKFPPPTGSMSR
jgi:hypothetical protein